MTTLRQIITRAGRVVDKASEGQPAAVAYDADVAMDLFNDMMREFRGQEIGQKLVRQFSALASDVAIPGGLYNVAVTTPCQPRNGDRFGVIGARTVTADSNDTIEGAASVTTTAGASWFYREDLGDWKLEADVANLSNDHPLSSDADEALVLCLVARWFYSLNAAAVSPTVLAGAMKGRARLHQLYGSRVLVPVASALLRGLAHRC